MNPAYSIETLRLVRRLSLPLTPALRLFFLGDGLGMLGGLFYQVALPSLVMDASGSAGAVGLAILLTGAARIGLVLVGGALCDRMPPQRLAIAAGLLRAGLLLGLWWVGARGWACLEVVYAFCLAFGVCDALQFPARAALLPRLAAKGGLQAANSLLSAQEKAIGLVGPALAGCSIAALNGLGWAGNQAALGLDALALAAGCLALGRMALPVGWQSLPRRAKTGGERGSFKDLARLLRRDRELCGWVGVVLGANLLSVGPLCVGLPVLAVSRFADGAQALGLLMSAAGGGALVGTGLAGLLPAVQARQAGGWALAAFGSIGVGLVGLWLATSLGLAVGSVLLIAAAAGSATVIGAAQVQAGTPPEMLGKMMGLINLK